MYNEAGVTIHLEKLGFGKSDEEIDFYFEVAKALGCVGITTERSEPLAKKLAPFADKHKIWVAFHNHTNNYPVMDKTDPILSYGQYIGFNFDVGHYFAGTKGLSPIPVIEKYHDRILSLHLKDRTADGGNLPWGQGKTPIKEILQLMKKEKWTFPGDIELEYKIPQGSDCVAEVAKCLQYCKRGAGVRVALILCRGRERLSLRRDPTAHPALPATPAEPVVRGRHPWQAVVVIVGTKKALARCVKRHDTAHRYTALCRPLRKLYG